MKQKSLRLVPTPTLVSCPGKCLAEKLQQIDDARNPAVADVVVVVDSKSRSFVDFLEATAGAGCTNI